ncbi:MAG: hypothetical protein Q8R92_15680 [Deltaproteobacteria bacterium]|nr:hypothetical protein [Deltaproteobacteria bacterium]
MAQAYPLPRAHHNTVVAAARGVLSPAPMRRLGLLPLLIVGTTLLLAGGCHLPARDWRWSVSGAETTWLDALGEARACDMALRLWAAPRSMWALPLPGSRPLFFGGEGLFLLAIVENRGNALASFDPRLVQARLPGRSEAVRVREAAEVSSATIATGEREARGFSVRLPRGEKELEVDLRDAASCADNRFVFRLGRHATWGWRRVGPGVPGF